MSLKAEEERVGSSGSGVKNETDGQPRQKRSKRKASKEEKKEEEEEEKKNKNEKGAVGPPEKCVDPLPSSPPPPSPPPPPPDRTKSGTSPEESRDRT
ncbi:hypothetical protein EAI_17027 [Harpegnathos saltator]|uniref:Uncharacterized protein n=1 Tax=Harpegnathos saltator TaxID=610380 RepID=E2C880_HARSA|nr:hypothetical protein EAI_17027 [Harpegnathos saltator]